VEVLRAVMHDALARVDVRVASGGDAVEAVVARCVGASLGVREVAPKGRSLENVFHDLTMRPPGTPAEPAAKEPAAPTQPPEEDAA
jgi:hypothetical protein